MGESQVRTVCKMTTGVDGSQKGVNFYFGKKDNAIYDNDGVGAEGLMRLLVVIGASSTTFLPKSSHPAMVPLP